MTFAVRVFAYSGVVPAKQTRVVQEAKDSVFLLREPYISSQKLVSNGGFWVSSAPLPLQTRLVRLEVDDGNTIQYEVQRGSINRGPSLSSPALSGRDLVYATEGDVISFVDASAPAPMIELTLAPGWTFA